MKTRGRLVLIVVAALAGAVATWPKLPPSPVPGAAAASLLGPLRPAVAAVVRLRFEARRRDHEVLGPLADAWRVLALQPDRVDDFANYAAWCLHDAPAVARSVAERDRCRADGEAMLAAGRALHGDHPDLDWVEGRARRLRGGAELPHALELLERAWRNALRDPRREFLAAELAACAAAVLGRDEPADRAAARAALAALLADDQTTPALREAVADVLQERGK